MHEILGRNFFEKLNLKKHSLQLDLSLFAFETSLILVNDLVMEKKNFCEFMSLEKKFRYFIKKMPKGKNTVHRKLLACIEGRFAGFDLVKKSLLKVLSDNCTGPLILFISHCQILIK